MVKEMKSSKQSISPKKWVLIFLLLIVAAVNISTMPAFRYGGDPTVIEFASVQLLNSGTISIPENIAKPFGDRGQFFFENTKTGKWYSKYGFANTIFFAIPRGIEKLITGELPYRSAYRVLSLNLFNVFLSLILFTYLFRFCGLYSESSWIQGGFCLSVFYSTYLWNYMRVQSSEIFQVLFFTGFCFYIIRYFRSYTGDDRRKIDLILGMIFLGILCLLKIVYILLLPGFFLVLWMEMARQGPKVRQPSMIMKRLFKQWGFRASLIFLISIVLIIALINNYKFGSIFETGYGQWKGEDHFRLMNIPGHLIEAFFHPQKSVFLNFPIIIFSLIGYRVFCKKYAFESFFIGMTILPVYVLVLSFGNWAGSWAYGPRYFLFSLPVLAIPFVFTIERLCGLGSKMLKYFIGLVILTTLICSAFLQWNVNSLKFNISYALQDVVLKQFRDPFISQYFSKEPFGIINYDLVRFRDKGVEPPFLRRLNPYLDKDLKNKISQEVLKELAPNYFWVRKYRKSFGGRAKP